MAACSNGTKVRRRWFLSLSLVAALAAIVVGTLLWQAVEISSLAVVAEHVDRAKPYSSGLRLALIGLLAVLWSRLPAVWSHAGPLEVSTRAHWMALRWRAIGWLLVIELVLAQNFLGRVAGLMSYPP